MKLLQITFFAFAVISCVNKHEKGTEFIGKQNTKKTTNQDVEQSSHNSKILDLSNRNLTSVPDLSNYPLLEEVNLSYNQITTIDIKSLPESVKKINLSHNKFTGKFKNHMKECSNLTELDISYNSIDGVSISCELEKLNASHNSLTYININTRKMKSVDISHNKELSNVVHFVFDNITDIKRQGILNDKPLVSAIKEQVITN